MYAVLFITIGFMLWIMYDGVTAEHSKGGHVTFGTLVMFIGFGLVLWLKNKVIADELGIEEQEWLLQLAGSVEMRKKELRGYKVLVFVPLVPSVLFGVMLGAFQEWELAWKIALGFGVVGIPIALFFYNSYRSCALYLEKMENGNIPIPDFLK